MSEDKTSYHHLYYSAHADPVSELEKLNQSQPCIKLPSPSKDETGTYKDSQYSGEKTATLGRSGHQRSSSRLLLPTSTTTTTITNNTNNNTSLTASPTRLVASKEKSCCSCCCLISLFTSLLLGFLAGLSMGVLAYRAGYGRHLESVFPFKATTSLSSLISPEEGRERGRVRCQLRMRGEEGRAMMETCAECLNTRLINVSNAGYADCDGLYTITNLTSVWDPKRLVYERIKGGINPQDKRYIYWNSHFYGPNFYGWSIGDKRSLTESGPFHAQGREGVSNHPWLGSWSEKVEVSLSQCGEQRDNIRFDKQRMTELKQKNQEKSPVRVNYHRGNQTDENE